MTTKAKGMSISKKLSDLAAKNKIPFKYIATAFLIERLVWRLLSEPKIESRLVFKGGFVGLRVYDSHRYTIDLDALLRKSDLESTLKLTRSAAKADLDDGAWFRFESQIDLETQGEYGGIRQTYRAGFGEIPKNVGRTQTINFDLGIGDPVEPVAATTDALLSGESLSWQVYPIETIIAEKLHALIERGHLNSRSKDVFDLSIFLPKAKPKALRHALKKCFEYRDTDLPKSLSENVKSIDPTLLARGWASAVSSVKNAPSFDATFGKLISLLDQFDKSDE